MTTGGGKCKGGKCKTKNTGKKFRKKQASGKRIKKVAKIKRRK